MRILEEIGIEFLNKEAADILKAHGATVDGENVRMDRDMELCERWRTARWIAPPSSRAAVCSASAASASE